MYFQQDSNQPYYFTLGYDYQPVGLTQPIIPVPADWYVKTDEVVGANWQFNGAGGWRTQV